jgi:hypothetical protein
MKAVTTAALLTLAVFPLMGQTPKEPASDLSIHTASVPGLEIRYVNYHWQPALFEAMEKGTAAVPEAKRDWVLARVIVEPKPLNIEGVKLPLGSYALSLLPNSDGKGLGIELRNVDVRELYPNLNVMAPTPPGRTMYKAPAAFEVVNPPAPRLDIKASESEGAILLTVNYGNRRRSLKLTR